MAALLFALMIVQAALVILFSANLPVIAALHPVNALILLGLSFGLVRGRRTVRPDEQAAPSRVR